MTMAWSHTTTKFRVQSPWLEKAHLRPQILKPSSVDHWPQKTHNLYQNWQETQSELQNPVHPRVTLLHGLEPWNNDTQLHRSMWWHLDPP